MSTKARTHGRIARIAAEQGWHEWSTMPNSSYLRRGTTSINLGFSRSGQLVHAMRYRPGGLSNYPSMEESFLAIPALEEGLMQALVVMDMVIQQPQLAPYLNWGGLPYEQN
jgi:hypothetical protein